jgi:HEAT repeat protein
MNRLIVLLFMFLLVAASLAATSPREQSWRVLLDGAADSNPVKRTQALTALGTIGSERPAFEAIANGLKDKDVYVRLTAVAALGKTRSSRSVREIQTALDDPEPIVRFVAAKTLWNMGNRDGRRVLIRVLSGKSQKPVTGLVKREVQSAKDGLYNRSALAKMGVAEGAGVLLGPFSMGVGFAEDLLKDKDAPQRVIAAELLAKDRSPASLAQLENALGDKNGAVRAAAAQAVASRRDRRALPTLESMLDDKSQAARFMAAASIVRLTEPPARRTGTTSPRAPRH